MYFIGTVEHVLSNISSMGLDFDLWLIANILFYFCEKRTKYDEEE